ncbi:uncharacterized protein LOC136068412 [Quercus suber]|uniref:uncharacterized protein LOC136068412 n=1 Tax=Quercus suber TaxID=58331 RepID=UPI0032DE84CB
MAFDENGYSGTFWGRIMEDCETYLGLPIVGGKSKFSAKWKIKSKSIMCQQVNSLLNLYEAALEQNVNIDKTSLSFSSNTGLETQESIKQALDAETVIEYEKYLGLPSIVEHNKKAAFAPVIERVWSKLKGWKEKMMSQAGREILIKIVAQAIPTYAMGYFLLPKGLLKDFEGLMSKFW